MCRTTVTLIASFLPFVGCQSIAHLEKDSGLKPPVAKIVAKQLEAHGDVRIDNYYWLKERDNPEVIRYLEEENAYTEAVMAPTKDLQELLYREIKGRIKQTDQSVPYRLDDYYYYTRYEDGKEYRVHCRKRGSLTAPEEVMIDANELAQGQSYFSLRGPVVSSGQDIIAYAIDTVGRRFYTLRFKNLANGEAYSDTIPNVTGNVAWANDNQTLFYTKQHPETLRSYRIYRHTLGTDPAGDQLVYEEREETFSCSVSKTKSKKYVMLASRQTLSTEVRYLDADNPSGSFEVFLVRQRDHEYAVDHFQDRFYVRTNDHAKNFRLVATPVDRTGRENWQEIIPHRDDVFLTDFEIFREHLVVSERKDGLRHIRVIPWDSRAEHSLDFGEPAYTAYVSNNPDFNTQILRYVYTSLTTPSSTYDYHMVTREKELLKRQEVLGGFDPGNYETERLQAHAEDGIKVPISLVYRKGTEKDGTHPLLLYAYGSYGFSMDARFSSPRLSLIDRGFIYAIAHVRGGQELGRDWYENGKLLKKKNTFTDFIACGRFLIDEKYTSSDQLFAMGGSAGGLLMGAVANIEPELFRGIVARVPWVDVVTTMLDSSIPLTTSEYDEWGDPGKKEYYDYMLSYSPYDNVEKQGYPNLLVTTGLHDSQVQYWEPAKWVAKLRAHKTDRNLLLLKTNMDAGHGGPSGRYRRYRDTAFNYSFLLDLAGLAGDNPR